ncbi:hypothetical protein [Rhizobium sp. RU36D]|uniref:hypothetical protein n=1 Tax=Rhizobium sp. RU36D TaxID=1907415 RepID=UPI0009D90492|nr:hypothetical protein [Rhizobium sp. RU36D]SMC75915.1 hypothetical protein SAMN05880593_10626 [Rhizobium sp. RU36D]
MTGETDNSAAAISPGYGEDSSAPQSSEKTSGLSFGVKDLRPKGGPTDENTATKSEPAAPQLYSVDTFDRYASTQLQQLRMMPGSDRDLHFWRHLRAIAAAADGLGLQAPDPVIAVVQREIDFVSLAVLAEEMGTEPEAPMHTVSLSAGSTAGNTPELLAGRLEEEVRAKKLEGEFILLVLPNWAITPAWESIPRDDADTPLKQFLRQAGKRLIIGIEPPPLQHLSQLVNSETGLSSLPWGLPYLAQLAAQNNFRATHFDRALVRGLDAESTWENFLDDQREVGRSLQFAGAKTRYREPGEMTGKLQVLLKETNFSLEHLWQLSEARANDAIGLELHATVLGEGIKAPAMIKRGLLCSAAFATGLASGRFLAIVRASLPEGEPISLFDLTKDERDEVMLLASMQGSEHKILPPLPTLRDYFDRHVDRICRAYDIQTDTKGNIELAESWRAFPLASYICARAPSMAIEYTKRLLAGAKDIDDLGAGEINPLVRIIATLQCHLPSGISRPQLAEWLLECAVKPFAREHLRAIQEKIAENGHATREAQQPPLDLMAEIAQAVAQAIIEFLTEFRKAAASAGLHSSMEQEGAYLRQAVLDQIVNSQLAVMLALFMILMDKDARPEEHDALESIVQKAITKQQQMSFILDLILFYFNRPKIGDTEARCAGACRLLAFFSRAASRPNSHPAWATARDKILSMLLSNDIRWPPNNFALLPYELHRRWIAIESVVFGEGDTGVPAIFREGINIVTSHFFARDVSNWLAESWEDWAAKEAPRRLYDTVMVLLDGPPAKTQYWATRGFERMANTMLNTLLVECGARGLASLDDYAAKLAACPDYFDPPLKSKPYVQLYSLFWPALLLFWRLRLFGVEPLDATDPHTTQFRAFLERVCRTASPGTIARMADGMKLLVTALDRTVLAAIVRQTDPAAHAFYSQKREAAARLEEFLRKRVAAGQSQGHQLLGSRRKMD